LLLLLLSGLVWGARRRREGAVAPRNSADFLVSSPSPPPPPFLHAHPSTFWRSSVRPATLIPLTCAGLMGVNAKSWGCFLYRSPCPTPPHPPPTPQEMSNAQDPATVPGADTQVKLRGWSQQGEGDESSHLRRHQELRAFLHLLGESTWGLAWKGL